MRERAAGARQPFATIDTIRYGPPTMFAHHHTQQPFPARSSDRQPTLPTWCNAGEASQLQR